MSLRLIELGQVDSTQARAWAAVEAGEARSGDFFVAQGQSAGSGTRGRSWHSPEGGLFASLVQFLPQAPSGPGAWTAAGALAILDVAAPAGALDLRLDWPNDVVDAKGAKLAGVLAELRPGTEGMVLVLGLGLNVGPCDFPAELLAERQVSDLHAQGCRIAPHELREQLAFSLDNRCRQAAQRSAALSADFRQALGLGLAEVRAEGPKGSPSGCIESLDLWGELCLRPESGPLQRIAVEHVTALEPAE